MRFPGGPTTEAAGHLRENTSRRKGPEGLMWDARLASIPAGATRSLPLVCAGSRVSHGFGLQHCFELGAHRPGRPPAGGMWTRPTEAPSSLRASAHTGLTTQLCGGESSTAACKHTSGVRRRRRRQGSPWQPGGRLHTSEAHASLPMHVQDESQPRAEQQRQHAARVHGPGGCRATGGGGGAAGVRRTCATYQLCADADGGEHAVPALRQHQPVWCAPRVEGRAAGCGTLRSAPFQRPGRRPRPTAPTAPTGSGELRPCSVLPPTPPALPQACSSPASSLAAPLSRCSC